MVDASIFDFESMKQELGADPFADTSKTFKVDERFYVLGKDKEGSGGAVIRFLPDAERGMIQQMFKINTTVPQPGDKKRFVSEFSPTTIGKPCPFQEKWQELWNAGDKEGSKLFSRGTRYVANIKVLKDPANPENEGKIFLYEMSGKMRDKIRAAIDPSEQDRALGAEPKEMFNPLRGNSFKLICRRGANGQINYDSSEVVPNVTSIYESAEEALKDIKENSYLLSSLLAEDAFLSYEELQQKFTWVMGGNDAQQAQALVAEVNVGTQVQPEVQASQAEVQQPQAEVAQAQPTQSSDLDSLLAGLV